MLNLLLFCGPPHQRSQKVPVADDANGHREDGKDRFCHPRCRPVYAALRHVRQAPRAQGVSRAPRHAGGRHDKYIAGTLAWLKTVVDVWYFAPLEGPRGATAEQLLHHLGNGSA